MKIMGDYHDLYLKTDVLLLCDVFEKFINTCSTYYRLDPCHYFSAPGLSWDAMLKMTGIKLDCINDIYVHLFIEKAMVGGILYVGKRYSRANNKYMKNYDASASNSYIMYFDANNLYGWGMSEYLPNGEFRWLTSAEISPFYLDSMDKNKNIGYILEVDLEYPSELHHLHNDYPLVLKNMRVTDDMLSKYCYNIAKKFDIKLGEVKKVVPSLENRTKYITHYKNLLLYMSLGIKVTNIHRILKFKQSRWMKKYIDFNTQKRMAAVNKFEKDFFKLMINSVYGKTMENLRNRIDVKLVNDIKKYLRWVRRPNFVLRKLFDENFAAIHMKKLVLTLN